MDERNLAGGVVRRPLVGGPDPVEAFVPGRGALPAVPSLGEVVEAAVRRVLDERRPPVEDVTYGRLAFELNRRGIGWDGDAVLAAVRAIDQARAERDAALAEVVSLHSWERAAEVVGRVRGAAQTVPQTGPGSPPADQDALTRVAGGAEGVTGLSAGFGDDEAVIEVAGPGGQKRFAPGRTTGDAR